MKRFLGSWQGKLTLIVIVGFVLRLLAYGFIKIPWIIFDEFIYIDTARQIARGHFTAALSRDPQLYPAGWPLVMTAVGGFINNPLLQYRVWLLLTMLISAAVPVLAYFLTGGLVVAAAVSIFPPLFVYSSSVMSETFYTFLLLLAVAVTQFIIRDDLKRRSSLILAGIILGLIIYYVRLTRSVGIVLVPAFILTTLVITFFQWRAKSLVALRQLLMLTVITIGAYYLWSVLGKLTLFPARQYYEQVAYIKSLKQAILRPWFSLVLLRNELTLSLFFGYFLLPLFSAHQTLTEWHKREWHRLFPRLWAVFIYLGSLLLTLLHMFIGTRHNPQYLIFSRYLDPILVVLFVYWVGDFWHYLTTKTLRIKIAWWVYLLIAYFVFYFVYKVPALDYKFGNTMPIYFFIALKETPWQYWAVVGLVVAGLVALLGNHRRLLLLFVATLFIFVNWIAIGATRATPQWVGEKYQYTIDDWQNALNRYSHTDIPICIHQDGISSETYYLYHFLYPYQYLQPCKKYEMRPKRILTGLERRNLPDTCALDFRFQSGEAIYFCPLGY